MLEYNDFAFMKTPGLRKKRRPGRNINHINFNLILRVVLRFAFVILITLLFITIKIRLTPHWANTTYLLLTSSVMLSAYMAGFAGGLLSTLINVVHAFYYAKYPMVMQFTPTDTFLQAAFFTVQSVLLSQIVSTLQRRNNAEYRIRKWFETTLSSIGDAVIVTDENGYVVFMNNASHKLTGWNDHNGFLKPLKAVFNIKDPVTGKHAADPIAAALQNGEANKSKNMEAVLIARDGTQLFVENSVSLIKNSEGVVTGAILIFRDITAKKEHERQLQKANRQIREIFESTTDAFFSIDKDGIITYVNNKAVIFMNRPKSRLLNHNFWELFPYLRNTIFDKKLMEIVRNKKQARFEFMNPMTNLWFSVNAYPMKKGIAVYFSDITKTKKIELELKKQQDATAQAKRQLQAIIDGTPDVVVVKDTKGKYITINKSLERMLGVSKESVKGKTDYDFFPRDMAESYHKNDQIILESGALQQVEEEALMKDGRHVFLANKFPLYDSSGNIYATCGVSTDITERKHLEQKKDEFMTVASHELKTPLTSVKAYVQILERIINRMDNAQAKLLVGKTNLYINRLHALITDLLDISRIQAGKLQMNKELINLKEVILQSVEGVQLFSPTHKISIVGLTDSMVYGDRHRIEQVIVNFLTNAIKYSPGKEKIILRVTETGNEVQVSVQDFGIGIATEKQKKLFTRFYRVEDTEKQFSGLGIGLYIANEIVLRHEGRMWVTSSLRKGSVFSFSLPLRKRSS